MSKSPLHGWLKPFTRRRPAPIRRQPRARLLVERFEDRALPSVSIPLNGFTWTLMGPSPIADGQSPGNPPSTGRLNGVAFDPAIPPGQTYPFPSDPNTIYVAGDTSGVWRTNDAGLTWMPQSDYAGGLATALTEVNRGAADTIYAAASQGGTAVFEVSTDGGQSFVTTSPFPSSPFGLVVTKLTAIPVNPLDQSQDIIYASVSLAFVGLSGDFGQGVYRSVDGGASFSRITTLGSNPFSASSTEFTDVAADPSNPNIVYAAVGNVLGDPFNGVYRTVNALSANPSWQLLIGGSQFVPGSTPGGIKIAVSPVLPSVIFASVALRADPQSGFVPLLGVFRSLDSGINWTPTLIANPVDQTNDPQNYMGVSGNDNNVIIVDPFSPANPLQQKVYVAGAGGTNNVMVSTNSTTTFTMIGVGANGVGPYQNVHQGQIDQQGRFVIATGGGIYRTVSGTAPVFWESLNGNVGPTGLATSQFYGFALHPTDPNRMIGNIDSRPVQLQNAVLFSDFLGAGNAAYGWRTIDSGTPPTIDFNFGNGVVIYNPFVPDTVYRVVPGGNGQDPIRRSTDGGLTWTNVGTGYPALPANLFGLGPVAGPRYVPALAIDPSRPNRLFSGYNQVFATDNDGGNWRAALQTTLVGGTIPIPPLPTTQITGNNSIGPIAIDALATGRQSNVSFLGFGSFNGAGIFAATETDANFDVVMNNYTDAAVGGPQLFFAVIPDLAPNQWPPGGTNYNNHYWAHITPPGLFGQITQIVADPVSDPAGNTRSILYVYSNSGQVFRCTNLQIAYRLDGNMNIIPDPNVPPPTWDDLTGNLSFGSSPVIYPQPLALDKSIVRIGNPPNQPGDRLYVGTVNGVFSLDNARTTTNPVWTEVGLNPADGTPTLPNVPVSTLSLNSTTGILGVATYGRSVYEIQIRGFIRGRVFEDLNGNGIIDPGEPPQAGLTVIAHNLTTDTTFATVTDANGFYEFRSLTAGNYDVSVIGGPGTFQTTTPITNFPITEQSTFDGPNQINFGFFRAGSISGTKFGDTNGNGVFDANEMGLPNFTIFLDANNNGVLDPGELSTVTDAAGFFTFTNLGPGTLNGMNNPVTFGGAYLVVEVQQPDFQQTTPNPPPIMLNSGQNVTGLEIGNFQPAPPGAVNENLFVVGPDGGALPLVKVYNSRLNILVTQFLAYDQRFLGGVRVASGDINSDGIPDVVTGAGLGGGPHVKVFTGTDFDTIREFMAYDPNFRGGIYIAVGDLNGDGVADIITGAGDGGGPHVRAFSGVDNTLLFDGMAYDIRFRGGVRVAIGDINHDGHADIITSAGEGGGPHVKVFSGLDGSLLASFLAYDPAFTGGVFVAAGDVNADGNAEVITGPGAGGGPHLKVFDMASGGFLLNETSPFPPFTPGSPVTGDGLWASGLRVATTDFGRDGQIDILVGPGSGRQSRVRILNGLTLELEAEFLPFDAVYLGGVNLGGN